MIKALETKSCEEIMTTVYKPIEFSIDGLVAQGLYILAGAPKVGKSWLALDMCLSIAKGQNVLARQTAKGAALYLCLEDSFSRIQNRLYDITDEPADELYFTVMSESIGNGLEEQITEFKAQHTDLRIVVIDTLQKIRGSHELSYSSDYKELSVLKALTGKLGITILLVHHTRKCSDADPFNMISGTTGISGCVDGSLVLIESSRGSRQAKLHCVGRDIENQEINVVFENGRWKVTDDIVPQKSDHFSFAIHDFMMEQMSFKGTATELSDILYRRFGEMFYPNRLTRDLLKHAAELQSYGVELSIRRSHGKRIIELQYSAEGDSGAGNILWVEVMDSTGTRSCAKPLELAYEQGDSNSEGDGKTAQGDSKTVQSDGRKSGLAGVDMDEIIHMAARKLGNMMIKTQKNTIPRNVAKQNKIVAPVWRFERLVG